MSDRRAVDGLIWATRGRSWGFRFLLDGGYEDPLSVYERAVSGLGDGSAGVQHVGDEVALRFPDPEGRRDAAGRVIPHEFVVTGVLATEITSVEEGVKLIWPLVAGAYAEVWAAERAPAQIDAGLSDSDQVPEDAGPTQDTDGTD